MNINDFYAWVENNPDKAKVIFNIFGTSDKHFVYSRLGNYSFNKISSALDSKVEYPFKHVFVPKLKEILLSNTLTFLVGPYKCGKTVALKQLASELPNVKYIPIKYLKKDARYDVLSEVEDAIRSNLPMTFLIDDFNYFNVTSVIIESWMYLLDECENSNTHVVIAGHSRALLYWYRKYFEGYAGFLSVDFLTYTEWLQYKGLECSAESYLDFILSLDSFHNLGTIKDYLSHCLEGAGIADSRTSSMFGDDNLRDARLICMLDILFSSLDYEYADVLSHACLEPDTAALSAKLYSLAREHRASLNETSRSVVDFSVRFLYNCGLVTLVPIMSTLTATNVFSRLVSVLSMKEVEGNTLLFREFTAYVGHPACFISLLKYALDGNSLIEIPSTLLGIIAECHIRHLLRSRSCLKYVRVDNQIDYVNYSEFRAVNFAVSREAKDSSVDLPLKYSIDLVTRDNYFRYILDLEAERGFYSTSA